VMTFQKGTNKSLKKIKCFFFLNQKKVKRLSAPELLMCPGKVL